MDFIIHYFYDTIKIMENNTTQINTTPTKSGKVVHVSIIVAIVIVMNMFFNYSVSLIFSEPVSSDYFKTSQVVEPLTTKESCLKVGGQWNGGEEYTNPKDKSMPVSSYSPYCNENYTNQINFDKAVASYSQKVFIVLISLGIISLIVAGFITIQILSIAFAWGGVLSLIIASMRYWSVADNIAKVVILAIALGLLIWLAIKKFNK